MFQKKKSARRSILFVGMPDSIHTARWIRQIADQDWQLYFFPCSSEESSHPDLAGVDLIRLMGGRYEKLLRCVKLGFLASLLDWLRRHFERRFPAYRGHCLAMTIKRLRPTMIHSMEMQGAAYLTLTAKYQYSGEFPKWLVTNWGSDIFFFGRLAAHKDKIRDVLAHCDFYSCECQRDVELARLFGFDKRVLAVLPNTGGYDVSLVENHAKQPTSQRKSIMLKGYQNWAGRALVGLRALERCADLLITYRIVIFSADAAVVMAAELFSQANGIEVVIVPPKTDHGEMLALHGQARISIGLSISDGISTSLLEAMAVGSFPIQSCTACANEWVTHGESGLIVPPDDVDLIEMAIRQALQDDELVNRAAAINHAVVQERLDKAVLKQQVVEIYQSVLD